MPVRIALVTWSGLADLSPDDQLLERELVRRGYAVTPEVWTDPGAEWNSYDAAVLRSTWDYHRRRDEFLAWAERCSRATRLWNPLGLVRWNSHKGYLLELSRAGLPIVPTELARSGETLEGLRRRRGWSSLVVKPAISANAERTHFVDESTIAAFEPTFEETIRQGEQIVQPFLEEVVSRGERSLVFFEGRYSHAFVKPPALPRDQRRGLQVESVRPSDPERELARRILDFLDSVPLYARVDLVSTEAAGPLLMELEVIEPFLDLTADPSAPARFAEALQGRLERK